MSEVFSFIFVYCLILGAVIGKTIHEFPASFSHRIPPSSWVEAISPYVTPTEEFLVRKHGTAFPFCKISIFLSAGFLIERQELVLP
jgi:hypothetical protein